jgi:hypothetical protein
LPVDYRRVDKKGESTRTNWIGGDEETRVIENCNIIDSWLVTEGRLVPLKSRSSFILKSPFHPSTDIHFDAPSAAPLSSLTSNIVINQAARGPSIFPIVSPQSEVGQLGAPLTDYHCFVLLNSLFLIAILTKLTTNTSGAVTTLLTH